MVRNKANIILIMFLRCNREFPDEVEGRKVAQREQAKPAEGEGFEPPRVLTRRISSPLPYQLD